MGTQTDPWSEWKIAPARLPRVLAALVRASATRSVLIAEIAEIGDVARFPISAKLARYTGCAHIPVYSSDKERHRLHRGGNRRLNSVFYTAAIVQKRWEPAAQRLLARHEDAKGSRGARRILQRHLVDVVHRAMLADQTRWTHQIARCQQTA